MSSSRLFLATAILVGGALGAAPALASHITYGMGPGGFTQLLGPDEAGLGTLHGDLTLDYDYTAGSFTFVASTVWLDNKDYVLSFTGGSLQTGAAGHLDFALVGLGQTDGGYAHSGSFFFVGGTPICCGSSAPDFRLVGQIGLLGGGGGSAGLTPVVTSTPMPEPSAAMAFAAGALFVHTALRRQTERQQRTKSD